jgi:hypothetical protein
MNRQVGATTVLAALLLMIGAVLLITQWPTHHARAMALSSPLFLVAELGVYLLLLVVLDRGLTALGYALGAVGALGMRIGLGFAAAGVNYLRSGGPYDAHLYPSIFSVAQVAVAAVTAGTVLTLLRDLLPQRRRPAPAARSQQAPGAARPGKPELASRLAFEVKPPPRPRSTPAARAADGPAPEREPTLARVAEPVRVFEGELELPLSALLRDAPEPLRSAQGCENVKVRLPLSLIGPQLAAARVAVTVGALCELAPEGTLDISNLDPAAEIVLPLEAIVPALPPDTLDLGPPSPPGWLVSLETEETLFCSA